MSSSSRKVNLFIVGAPKCGTTTLFALLKSHPHIFMSSLKEPHYFSSDIYLAERITSDQDYKNLFRGSEMQQVIGEASTSYLYSRNAARLIARYNPDAKIIIMLRNPVEMLYSWYHHMRYSFLLEEDKPTFEEALRAESDRKKVASDTVSGYYFYRDVARYSEQIERYFVVFPKEQIHIILFEDFIHDIPNSYKEILGFLGVDQNHHPEIKNYNPHRAMRAVWIRKLILKPPYFLRLLARTLIPRHLARQTWDALDQINIKRIEKKPLSQQTRVSLYSELSNEIETLRKLLGKDLACWSTDNPTRESNIAAPPL